MDINSLQRNALLAHLTIGGWSGRKFDRKATLDAITANKADVTAGRFSKVLIKSPALRAWHSHASAMRSQHHYWTLPWSNDGARMLPVAHYEQYRKVMSKMKEEAEEIIKDIERDYDDARERAKERLGTLYNPADYPDITNIVSRFYVNLRFSPVPGNGDWRVSLGNDAIKELKEQLGAQYEDMLASATKDAWERVYQMLERIKDRVDDPDKTVHKSLFENARELIELLPGLNVANDPQLTKMTEQMRLSLQVSVEDVRYDENVREKVHKDVSDMLDSMSAFFTPADKED